MNKFGVVVFFLTTLITGTAQASRNVSDLRQCNQSCDAVADECEFINDLETCVNERRACHLGCEEADPTMTICLEQCEGLHLFCRASGEASPSSCIQESKSCERRCDGTLLTTLQ